MITAITVAATFLSLYALVCHWENQADQADRDRQDYDFDESEIYNN